MTFTVSATNRGSAAAADVVLTDQLPPNSTLVSATPQAGSCSTSPTISCHVGALAVGQTISVVVTLIVRASGLVVNSATAATQPTDFRPGNDHADGNVTVDFSGTGDGTFPSYQSPGNTTHYLVFGTGTLVSATDDINSGKLVISGVACKKGKK